MSAKSAPCGPCSRRETEHPDGSPREWLMTIDQGAPRLACPTCGQGHPIDDVAYLEMKVPLLVTATYKEDHPNLGGWHDWNLEPCDCNSWFEIDPVPGGGSA